MANKTIYVSTDDEPLFEEAKEIAGEALSSVISRALREYVTRSKEKQKGAKEISVKVGMPGSEREQRFVGQELGKWTGFSSDKQWYMGATIYKTQKNNWAIYLSTIIKASLLTDKDEWKKSGDYLLNPRKSELIVGKNIQELKGKVPQELFEKIVSLEQKVENPIEYLDI